MQVEIVDKNDEPTGEVTSLVRAIRRGLLYRAAHAIVFVPNNKVLVQKRSSLVLTNPRKLDISVGGIVNPGERPEDAIKRELFEELGLKASTLKFIDVTRYDHIVSKRHKRIKHFTHNYAIYCQCELSDIKLQRHEVSKAYFLSMTQIKELIDKGKLKNFGRLDLPREYYTNLLTKAQTINSK